MDRWMDGWIEIWSTNGRSVVRFWVQYKHKQQNHSNFIASLCCCFCPSHHENEQMSFHHYVYVYMYASIYHSYSIHRESLMCCYSTRRTHAISSNGQNTRRKKCQNPQERAKSAQKTPSILRFYASKRHKHIWHFNVSSLDLSRTTATHAHTHKKWWRIVG